MNLPDRFIHNMRDLLAEDYPAWRDSLLCVPYTGIRINELKITKEDFSLLWKKCGGDSLKEIPWIHNGFFTDATSVFSGHPLYQAGLFYIQEPSAMTPAENLPVQPGDRVLDLCAAPGGKSTELLAKLGGTGLLLSNDLSASRAAALRKNLELAGALNTFVTVESPEKLSVYFKDYFDKILVDAPCSGEGMFRRDPGMASAWEEKGPLFYAGIQAEILDAAVSMLKAGGLLMYSTCTFSVMENEANVMALIDRFPDMELVAMKEQEGFSHGVLPGSEKCVRIYPHRMRGEGQFLALLKKKLPDDLIDSVKVFSGDAGARQKASPLPNEQTSSVEKFPGDAGTRQNALPGRTFFIKNDEVYLIPEGVRPYASLRYLMTGLHFGTLKKNRLIPSQALAEALRHDEWDRCLNLAANDIRTIKYLRGETISADAEEILKVSGRPERILCGADPASVLIDCAARRGGTAAHKERNEETTDRHAKKKRTADRHAKSNEKTDRHAMKEEFADRHAKGNGISERHTMNKETADQRAKRKEARATDDNIFMRPFREILILVEGYPVGFGAYDNGRVKNLRAPGRRLL